MNDRESAHMRDYGLQRPIETVEQLISMIHDGCNTFWLATSNGTVPLGYAGPFTITVLQGNDQVTVQYSNDCGNPVQMKASDLFTFAAQCVATTVKDAAQYHEAAWDAYLSDRSWQRQHQEEMLERTSVEYHDGSYRSWNV